MSRRNCQYSGFTDSGSVDLPGTTSVLRYPVTLMSGLGFQRPHAQLREGIKANQCAYRMKEGHWKGEYPKSQKETKWNAVSWPILFGYTHERRGLKGPGAPRSTLEITPRSLGSP